MKIIIAGSRNVDDYNVVRSAVIESGYWKAYGKSIEVVCGMALSWKWEDDPVAGGVDRWGYEFAKRNGLKVHEFHANWKRYGKRAGYIRNVEMGEFTKMNDGLLLAVWDGKSKGTQQMIQWAIGNELNGFIYRTDKPVRYAKVGTKVRTDFSGKWTTHTITARMTLTPSQSGIALQVTPAVPKSSGADSFIDADWFKLEEE